MKVGDLVNYKPETDVLHCGSGVYEFAVVASMSPFILVSEHGDMMWTNIEQDEVVTIGKANRKQLLAVMDRFKRELPEWILT